MRKTLLALVAAIILGFPSGWMVAMALTPVFWRLEPILHMELAGHSGPSDWLILLIMAITMAALFVLLLRIVPTSKKDR